MRSHQQPRASIVFFGLSLLCALILGFSVEATSVVPPANLGQLGQRAHAVVLVKAIDSDTAGVWPALRTITRFQVIEVLKGPLTPDQVLPVSVPGGEANGLGWIVDGSPRFVPGDSYLLSLDHSPSGEWQPIVSSYGLLHEMASQDGKTVLLAALPEVARLELATPRDPVVFDPVRTYTKERLLPHLREVILEKKPWNTALVLSSDLAAASYQPLAAPASCSLYSVGGQPIRWNAFNGSATISIQADQTGDRSIEGGGFSELEDALKGWSSISGSSVRVQYAGKKAISLGCSANGIDVPPLGTNAVIFNDPCSDIPDLADCFGTLAVGGPYYTTALHNFDGQTWKTIAGWFVIVNNGSGCLGSSRYKMLLGHELGHGLGFDHSSVSAAMMNARCCNALGQADKSCAQYLYPGEVTAPPATETQFVPVIVDIETAATRYSSELTLTNRRGAPVVATVTYRPSDSAGGTEFSTTASIGAGSQVVIPDAMAWLRESSPVFRSGGGGSEVGTLRVDFEGSEEPGLVSTSVRTLADTEAPQPVGSACLSYLGSSPDHFDRPSNTIFGLRANGQERSNLAVFNAGPDPVTVRITAFAGDGSGRSEVLNDNVALPAYGWIQFNRVLDSSGLDNAWITVEKTSGSGQFGAYGVVNDNFTNDGSFIEAAPNPVSGDSLTVPVIVESATYKSELVLANRSQSRATLTLQYVESACTDFPMKGTASIELEPMEQRILPSAVGFLRELGLAGPEGACTYAGALRITVSGIPLSSFYAGARTLAPSPAGGQFGLFTPPVYQGQEAGAEAFLYGLKADASNRSNVAVLNASALGGGTISLAIHIFDGDAGGIERGTPESVTLGPGQWLQFNNILRAHGIENGWVQVVRTSGVAPWIAYGVINDGASPGERTGDGAYIPMSIR